ncbi:JmjC domain-containing protein [Streptomyces bauhiniae]|uniref:JmjC domain-containing protein n=1 Tax=Streptomyces bauhiniae TaxID=2340725 RepID=UPI0035DB0035
MARLSEEIDRQVEAFFFVTPAGGQGLTLHRDDADVFVLQVAGSKTWYVHDAPTDGDWAPGDLKDSERSPRLLRTVLTPGSVLYVPRGFAHRAVGADGLSAHLSATVREISSQDLRAALDQQISDAMRLPARPLGDAGMAEASAAILSRHRAVLDAITPQDLQRATRALRPRQPARPAAPQTFTDAARTWQANTSHSDRAGLTSLTHTWRNLRHATRPAR